MEESGDGGFWEEFLNVYHNHECLWNSKCSSYSDRRMRNNAYEELVHLCKPRFPEATREFVVKKIHNFRSSFRRELNKIRQSKKSGTSTDEVYVSTLWYFNHLSFLTDDETPRVGIASWDKDDNNVSIFHYLLIISIFIHSLLIINIFVMNKPQHIYLLFINALKEK